MEGKDEKSFRAEYEEMLMRKKTLYVNNCFIPCRTETVF